MPMRLTHLSLGVADHERSRRFYESLGFTCDGRRDAEGCLHLTDDERFDLTLSASRSMHFGIQAADPRAVREMRTSISPDSELYDSPDKVAFQCTDPDGYRVEVFWQAPSRPAARNLA
jgi:catechol 2,3-dioxygenase-like lactoylglutathione lyase family enzyme